jgi:tol-pal system protein YbgF
LPEGSAPERYDHAVSLLRRSEYDEAEKALGAFITLYPSDPLTGNAQYWLAESYYVRGQYEKAAGGFLECYTKYPKSSKAPDSLLKLGMSLNQLGQKKEACATFDQLKRELPNASDGVKQLALTEAKRAGCR